jgi:hypothetical protein
MNKSIAFVLSIFLVSCATPGQLAKENNERFSSMTLESINACTTIRGDEMTEVLTFSSYNCFRAGQDFLRNTWFDIFVRGYKSKISGNTQYEVYVYMTEDDWSRPYSATYLKPKKNGEQEIIRVDTRKIDTDVSCQTYTCSHTEEYTFPLDKSYLKTLSDNYEDISAKTKEQKMRMFRRALGDKDFIFNINELVGVYRKVESF